MHKHKGTRLVQEDCPPLVIKLGHQWGTVRADILEWARHGEERALAFVLLYRALRAVAEEISDVIVDGLCMLTLRLRFETVWMRSNSCLVTMQAAVPSV